MEGEILLAIKCNNCGGDMKYHIRDKVLKCEHCSEKVSVTEYGEVNKNATQINEEEYGYEKQMETSLFQCPECGAEIRSFEETSTIFCPYCGKQTFLKQTENSLRPKNIIPFKKTQSDLKQNYEKFVNKKLFVPKNLKNPESIKEFRGVYIPCWNFTYETNGEFSYNGSRSYYSGGYDYHETYAIDAKVEGEIENITFDASEAFDDTLSSTIAPFDIEKSEPFHEGYCAGFYMDKENVDSNKYNEMAEASIANNIKNIVEDSEKGSKKITITGCEKEPKYIKKKTDLTLLPVWFMTYRNKDRVSYSVANGQTGKMVMDLPVDKKGFFVGTTILAAILSVVFIILFSTILHSMTATTVSYISLITLFISSWMLCREMKMIYDKDNKAYDIGSGKSIDINKITKKQKGMSQANVNKIGKIIVVTFILLFTFGGVIFSIMGGLLSAGSTKPSILTVLLTLPLIIFQIMRIKKLGKWKTKNEPLLGTISLIIMIIGAGLYLISSPNDWIYYGLSGLSVIGIILNALGCINGFDYLTSRPVPNFFKREVMQNETTYN